ncbi:hypothetical protein BIY29_00115 [Brenneria alni]|uniref:Uncharacterized protein n=1 Tax=Brenneria alni TaxID=71656 RepID=A0A421DTM7_9GAMM|nr:hypothetical protein BIY29_00115 [Brenneria alni]
MQSDIHRLSANEMVYFHALNYFWRKMIHLNHFYSGYIAILTFDATNYPQILNQVNQHESFLAWWLQSLFRSGAK